MAFVWHKKKKTQIKHYAFSFAYEFKRSGASIEVRSGRLYHLESNLPEIRAEGEFALRRLLPVAFYLCGQSSVLTRFLLNLDSGERFRFDMTDRRRLDYDIHEDCLLMLKMDRDPLTKGHQYFDNGSTS